MHKIFPNHLPVLLAGLSLATPMGTPQPFVELHLESSDNSVAAIVKQPDGSFHLVPTGLPGTVMVSGEVIETGQRVICQDKFDFVSDFVSDNPAILTYSSSLIQGV